MVDAGNGARYRRGSALGARDSRNHVSWLGADLLTVPTHEAPLQTGVRERCIFHPLPRAPMGTIDSEYHP